MGRRTFGMNRMAPKSPRESWDMVYNTARANLMLVTALSAVNVIMAVAGGGTYFMFSAYIPYILTLLGMLWCGMLPQEYYEEDKANLLFVDKSVFIVLTVVAVVMVGLYLLSWSMSSRHRVGWMITALVFFAVDTVCLLLLEGIYIGSIVNILFHGWVLYIVSKGVYAHYKWQALPEAVPAVDVAGEPASFETEGAAPAPADSPILRAAADVKHRVLVATEIHGHKICYRRVKRVNEMVIDGMVYAEYEALMEAPHALTATVDGHTIEVGCVGTSCYVCVDGHQVATKVRWY